MNSYGNSVVKFLAVLVVACVSQASYANGVAGKLESAKPVSGVVTGSGVDRYTFPVPDGETFVVSVSETGEHSPGFTPSLKVIGPDNKVTDSGAQAFYDHVARVCPARGTWTVEVGRQDGGTGGGAYELKVITVSKITATELKFGKSLAGTLSRGSMDGYFLWTGFGATGKLTLTAKDGHGFLPEVRVFGDGIENIGSASCADSCSTDLKFNAPGGYRIVVWRKDLNDSKGNYTLSLTGNAALEPPVAAGAAPRLPTRPLTPPPGSIAAPPGPAGPPGYVGAGPPGFVSAGASASPLPFQQPMMAQSPQDLLEPMRPAIATIGEIGNGKPVTGNIKGDAIDRYTFKASKGGTLMVSLSEKGAHIDGFFPELRLFGPDNMETGMNDGAGQSFYTNVQALNVPAGDWRIDVVRGGRGQNGGDYELRALQVPGYAGTPITFKKSYAGAVPRGSVDVYTIHGTPDVTAELILTATSRAGFSPRLSVFAPDGAPLPGFSCLDRCSGELSMTGYGDYTVIVSRIDRNDNKGLYSLFVKRKGDKEEPPPTTSEIPYLIAKGGLWAEDSATMRRRAEIYVAGQFINILLTMPPREDFNAAQKGDVLKQLYYGDGIAALLESDAVKWWKMAAEQGNTDARNRLAVAGAVDSAGKKYEAAPWYRFILGQVSPNPDIDTANTYVTGAGGQNLERAEKLYKAIAEKGVAQAQFNLAVLYTLGIGGKPDYSSAAKWYTAAAAQGLVVAENNLAELYAHGQGVPQDNAEAAKWYRKAADSGYPPAQYHLASLAGEGRGLPKDAALAAGLLKKAADGGYEEARAELNVLQGKGADAMRYWQKMAASGDQASLRKLVETARKNGIAAADRDDLLETYRISAQEVNPEAFLGLADLFAKQAPPDNFEAYFWYRRAADTAKTVPLSPDEKDAITAYASGEAARIEKELSPEQLATTKGRIKDHSPDPLLKTPDKAAPVTAQKQIKDENNAATLILDIQYARAGDPQAWSHICYAYEFGLFGLRQDTGKAVDYCKRSIREGWAEAATTIGDIYLLGIGIPPDYEEAAKWYEMAASRGSRDARNRLGWLYLRGIPGSGKRAIEMYEKSAALDELDADDALGMIYLYGAGGVKKDLGKALKWYLMAADKGDLVGSIQAAAILKDEEPHDYARALKLVSTLVEPVALNNAAFMYEHGLGVKEQPGAGQDAPTALELYQKAADMCYGRAMYNIGRLYETGATSPAIAATPIKADPALARRWMERAAFSGSTAAALWLEARNPDTIKSEKIPEEEVDVLPEPCPKPEPKEDGKP